RPGTDGALALGIANEIISKGLYDKDFVNNYVIGFEEYKQRVSEFDKQRVSKITWVSVDTIERIAKTFATHGPALITTAPAGMNHYTNGNWSARAVHSLLAICGYLGVSGGGFQYLSSDNSPFNGLAVNLHALLEDSTEPVVPSGTYIPEYVLSHQESPLKVLVVQAASPVTQWPNTKRTIEAFEKIPLKICIDLELTDTAKLCDIVLPATFIFEHDNLIHSELHRIVQFAPKIVEPRGEAKSEFDIWKGIAERVGLEEYFQISELEAIKLVLDSEECRHISIEALRAHPEGIRTSNQGIPFKNRKFNTSSGKVELYSSELENLGYDPLPFYQEPLESLVSKPLLYEKYPLTMITGRLRERLHSQYTTVKVGGTVKSFAYCTSCKKCIEECPDEAISLVQPSPHLMQKDVELSGTSSAKLRIELGALVAGLAVTLPDEKLDIPVEMTSLMIPVWDATKCIGCRECQLDVCPYNVVTDTIQIPPKNMAGIHQTFLRMHPDTASNLELADGDRVTVESVRGKVENVRLELTEDVDPRVVWSSDGWWQDDGNINLLTDDKHTAFGSTPGFNSVLVRVFKG
ncbi:hypothetical protein E4H12_11405, partial [Candidatus Thorarchaeota archaeon]